MKQTAEKTAHNAIKREVKRDIKKPAYQNTIAELKKFVQAGKTDVAKARAQNIMKSGNSMQKMAAEDFLKTLI